MCWGQHSAAYLLRCVKDHIHQEMHMEVSGFREELHFKLKRYIHVVRAEGFLSFSILILEVGWLLVPLSQGLLIFKRST